LITGLSISHAQSGPAKRQQALGRSLPKSSINPNFRHPLKADYQPRRTGRRFVDAILEGAVVVIDNASGGIRALVGGRDYAKQIQSRAPANRQIGSAFKPSVYAIAFTHGLCRELRLATARFKPAKSKALEIGHRPIRMESMAASSCSYGLIHSRNTMSVRVGQFAGSDAVQKVAATLNLGQNIPAGPATYIGSFETNLRDLTAAYAVFPNGGVRKQAYVIERIDDQEHKPIYLAAHISTPALDPSAAWMTSQLMEEVLTNGTAATARSLGFKLPAAGKTGTTNDYKDAWFLGYTSTLTCGVWVGFDQPTTIVSRGYGATLSLPIWTQVMKAAGIIPPSRCNRPCRSARHSLFHFRQLATGCMGAGSATTSTCLPTRFDSHAPGARGETAVRARALPYQEKQPPFPAVSSGRPPTLRRTMKRAVL
jgi:penicillin-binding protein 1A